MFRIDQMLGYMPYRTKQWSVGSTPVQIAQGDPTRAYLYVFNHTGSQMFMGFDGSVTGTEGPIGINSFTFFELWWERQGVLVTLPLFAAISAAPGVVWTTEVYWRPTQQ